MKQKNNTLQLTTKKDLIEIEERTDERFERIENLLKTMEERINKRVTKVGDLITIAFTNSIMNHEKRIKKLEKLQSTL